MKSMSSCVISPFSTILSMIEPPRRDIIPAARVKSSGSFERNAYSFGVRPVPKTDSIVCLPSRAFLSERRVSSAERARLRGVSSFSYHLLNCSLDMMPARTSASLLVRSLSNSTSSERTSASVMSAACAAKSQFFILDFNGKT